MLQGYRTYIAAGLMAAFGVLATFDWVGLFNGDPKAGIVALLSAIVMAVLRSITSTPPGVKAEEVKKIDTDLEVK